VSKKLIAVFNGKKEEGNQQQMKVGVDQQA
jgi:hypothetical protein